MTLAFAFRAVCMVGNAARMRASLVTEPSLMGTFKSSRISTRLPERSRLVIFLTFMLLLRGGSRAARPRRLRCSRSGDFRPCEGGVEHAIGKSPFIIVPSAHFHQRTGHDLGERRIVGRRGRIMVEIDRNQRRVVVGKYAFQRSIGGGLDDR